MARKSLLALALVALAATAIAAAPRALSIYLDDTPFAGKALWYKDRVYVSLEDLAGTMNATYSFKPSTGEVRVTFPARGASSAAPAVARSAGPVFPHVKVAWEQKYVFPNNAKIVAQFKNEGEATARSVEVVCIFKDTVLKPITADVKYLGDIEPGGVRTAEFYLYPGGGYAPGAPIASGGWYGYAGFGIVDDDKISIRGTLSSIHHEFRLTYPNALNSQGR
jgi:hypothetical protein